MMGEGTVNDEELVEVIEKAVTVEPWDQPTEARELAKEALAALRSAGFQVLRGEPMELPVSYHTDHYYLPVPEIYPKGPKALVGSSLKVGDFITVLVPAESPKEE